MLNLFSRSQNSTKFESKAKVIAVLNQKGGVGKTTMAFNLARALVEKGHSVLCLDMDPQANLSLLLGYEFDQQSFNIHHLLINSVKELKPLHTAISIPELIETCGEDKAIDYIPAGQELSGFELSMSAISAPRQLILNRFLAQSHLKDHYDYIVIDGPPTLGLLVVNILCASDGVIIPFQPDQFSRKGLEHFHQVLDDVADMGITKAPKVLSYIPNLVDNRRKQVHKDFDLIKKELASAPMHEGFANKVQLVRACAQNKSVFDYKAKEFLPIQEQFLNLAQSVGEQLV